MIHRVLSVCCLALAVLFLSVTLAPEADAARFGGGKSFGGRSAYSRSAPAPQQSGGSSMSRQQAQGQNLQQNAAPGMAPRSGFGGMLGGLLAGTLLGSLLFGGGFGGFGMMDMLLVALVAFLGLKLLRMVMARREAAPEGAGHARSTGGGMFSGDGAAPQDAWQRMRDTQSAPGNGAAATTAADAEGTPGAASVPPGFDQEDFLRGAKMLFARLQDSWDKRDIADIATFATPTIVREVEEQAAADPKPSVTEVLLVNANLVSVECEDGNETATVFFDVLIRENPEADTPTQVRELWHFIRPVGSTASWRLDGIQQVS